LDNSQYLYWANEPVFFSIAFGDNSFSVRYYGVFFMLAFLFGFLYMKRICKIEKHSTENLDSILNYMLIGTIIGARLGHCLFYDPRFFLENPLEILYIWKGGLASHGGVTGIIVSLYFYSRKHPTEPLIWLFDRLAIPSAFGAFLIRMGNFFNSEIVGDPTTVPWAIVFESPENGMIEGGIPRHPSMLYEAIPYLLIFFILGYIYRIYTTKLPRGLTLGLMLILIFITRFFVEFTKTRQESFVINSPFKMGQFLSIPFIVVGVILVIIALKQLKNSKNQNTIS
jgi:phosphatidylglycerol:prolipoprotein diacylglycerol transferase